MFRKTTPPVLEYKDFRTLLGEENRYPSKVLMGSHDFIRCWNETVYNFDEEPVVVYDLRRLAPFLRQGDIPLQIILNFINNGLMFFIRETSMLIISLFPAVAPSYYDSTPGTKQNMIGVALPFLCLIVLLNLILSCRNFFNLFKLRKAFLAIDDAFLARLDHNDLSISDILVLDSLISSSKSLSESILLKRDPDLKLLYRHMKNIEKSPNIKRLFKLTRFIKHHLPQKNIKITHLSLENILHDNKKIRLEMTGAVDQGIQNSLGYDRFDKNIPEIICDFNDRPISLSLK